MKICVKNELENLESCFPRQWKKTRKSSIFKAVTWGGKSWQAQFKYAGKFYGCGNHAVELDAAKAVNAMCAFLKIPLKNPGIGIGKLRKPRKKTSKFRGVTQAKRSDRWRAYVHHEGQQIMIGTYETEDYAARAVNLQCNILGISPKNPSAGVAHYLDEGRVISAAGSKRDYTYYRAPPQNNGKATKFKMTTSSNIISIDPLQNVCCYCNHNLSENTSRCISGMTESDVLSWVKSQKGLDVPVVVNMFQEFGIKGEELPTIDMNMLKEMNIPTFFATRLTKAVNDLLNSQPWSISHQAYCTLKQEDEVEINFML